MSVGEASDVTLARKESSAMMAMLRALMTEIIVKMDQHTEKIDRQTTIICQNMRKIGLQEVKMDEQAAQMNLAAENPQVREEVVAAPSPVSDQQLCGVTGHCELRVSVADMEEPCLLGLNSLFWKAACDALGRMQRQVRGEIIPLVLEDAVEQVESLVTSSDVEDERLERHCGVVRGEAADATEEACGSQTAVSSCGGEVNGGTGKVGPGGSGSRQSKTGQHRDGSQHVHPVLGWIEEGEQPCREEFSLHIQDGVWQRRVEDAATQQTWLLVNPFSMQVEFLEASLVRTWSAGRLCVACADAFAGLA